MQITLSSPACRKAAALLEAAAEGSLDPSLFLLCARCLYEAADFGPNYIHDIRVCYSFLSELDKKIKEVGERKADDITLHDLAFELVECLAVLARENTMDKGTQHALPMQAEVMDHFENCGEWTPRDGTLVSHYYYHLLPGSTAPGLGTTASSAAMA